MRPPARIGIDRALLFEAQAHAHAPRPAGAQARQRWHGLIPRREVAASTAPWLNRSKTPRATASKARFSDRRCCEYQLQYRLGIGMVHDFSHLTGGLAFDHRGVRQKIMEYMRAARLRGKNRPQDTIIGARSDGAEPCDWGFCIFQASAARVRLWSVSWKARDWPADAEHSSAPYPSRRGFSICRVSLLRQPTTHPASPSSPGRRLV